MEDMYTTHQRTRQNKYARVVREISS